MSAEVQTLQRKIFPRRVLAGLACLAAFPAYYLLSAAQEPRQVNAQSSENVETVPSVVSQGPSLDLTPTSNGHAPGPIQLVAGVDVASSPPSENQVEIDPIPFEKIWGIWKMDYYGPRYLEIQPDGTARLVSFPDMMAQMVVGSKMLSVQCAWTRKDKRIDFLLKEGKPKASFQYVTKTFGDKLPYEFVSVNDSTLVFRDISDGKLDNWTRVLSIPTAP